MKLKACSDGGFTYLCPCGDLHHVTGLWSFNGNMDRPTFSPSVLVRAGHYCPGAQPDDCWCTYNAKHPEDQAPFTCYLCHSFVTDGQVQFLSDCSHKLAGQTVPLPDIGRS